MTSPEHEQEQRDRARQESKEKAGRAAAELVRDGMRVGLGTGSTVHFSILALGERRPDIVCVATSERTATLALSLGLRVRPLDEVGGLDIAIDGADEVDCDCNLIKGGGGAHLREKVVADAAERFVAVVDESKIVARLGAFGVPLEVLDFAPLSVQRRLRDLGAARFEPVDGRSDNGNLLVRAWFGEIVAPEQLAADLAAIPGVLEHGIFLAEMVDRVYVAGEEGVQVRGRVPPPVV